MKIKELIKILEKYDPNIEVIMSADEEGNAYGFLEGAYYEHDNENDKDYITLYPVGHVWEE